jgi:hypothetical protein
MRRCGAKIAGAMLIALAIVPARPALSQECDDESWFCEEAPAEVEPVDPAPEPEPSPCDRSAQERDVVVVVETVCAAKTEPAPAESQPPEEERREQEFRQVGLVLAAMARTVVGSDDRGGAFLGGGSIQMRLRAVRDLALDIGFAAMVGPEDGGQLRSEMSAFTDLLWYPADTGEIRGYLLFGGEVVGATSSWEAADGTDLSVDHAYAGPRGGLGLEIGGSDWAIFFDAIYAPRFPIDQAAESRLGGDDYRSTIQLRGGVLGWW